jgi:hypothetical protein
MGPGMKRRLFLAFIASVLTPVGGGATPETDLLAQLASQLEQHAIVKASFVQTRQMAALKRPIVTRGHMAFSRRDGVFWWIEQPLQVSYWLTEQRVVEIAADGSRREHDQRSNAAMAQVGRLMRAMLGAQTDALRQQFEIKVQGNPAQWEMELTPRQSQVARYIKELHISGGRFIESLRVQEVSGDLTTIRLSDSQVLADLPAADVQRLVGTR